MSAVGTRIRRANRVIRYSFLSEVDSGQPADCSPYYAAREKEPFPVLRSNEISGRAKQRSLDSFPANKMPNTASAKKRLRQNDKRRQHNRSLRSRMRTQIRRVREAVESGDSEKAQTEFRIASKRLDQAAAKNLIHKNAAARSKSRLSKLVKSAG